MPLRRLVGYALFCVGGVTTAFVGGRYALGEIKRQEARRAWDDAEARAVVALARRSAALEANSAIPIADGAPVAHLVIPKIALDEIVLEGVDGESLNAGPGHLPGSAYPGETGNAIISAHRDRHFARLGDVDVGDTVLTEAGTHRTTWVIISKRVIAADAPALYRTRDATLTLTTCWPIRYLGSAPDRLLLAARPVGGDRPTSFASVATE